MALWSNIRSFLMKEDYDFERPDTTLHNFHPQLRMCFAINGLFFNNRDTKLRFVIPVLCILLGLTATGFELMFIYHGVEVKDYSFASECFFYLVALGTVPIVYTSILCNSKIIMTLIEEMDEHFQVMYKLGSKYQKRFLKGQLLIWNLCCAWFGFCLFTCALFIGNTVVLLLYQSLIAPQNEHMVRPLIFPLWLPADDPYRTPNYEVFMFLEIGLIAVILFNFGVYVYTLFHIQLHYYSIMEMIIIELGSMFTGLEDMPLPPPGHPDYIALKNEFNVKIKRIVQWHNSVFKSVKVVSSVYGPPLVYQVMFSSVAICLLAYQIADKLENGKVDYLFSILLFGTCVQLWIPCYLGTIIRNKAWAVGDACWNCGWETTPIGLMLRTDLTLIMIRSQQPLTIQFTGLPSLTLETFSSIMSTSYSYFNMLRQSTS